MKLLFEDIRPKNTTFNDVQVILEQKANQPRRMIIKGKYISCDIENQNGRIYKFDYMNRYCIPEYRKVWIEPHRAYGELNHRQDYSVDVKLACDLTTSLEPDGTDFIGQSIVLCTNKELGIPGTPNGDILAAILSAGGKIGKSTRGAVDNPQNNIIDENNKYSLICIDTVTDPSGKNCYVNEVMMENKDFMVNEHGIVVECAYNQLQRRLKNTYKSGVSVEYRQVQLAGFFKEFLNNVNKI